MKIDDTVQVLAWLQRRPSAHELRAQFPDLWDSTEQELQVALEARDPARLHCLLKPVLMSSSSGSSIGKQEQRRRLIALVRQRMAALAIERYSLMAAQVQSTGGGRLNLWNGWCAQRLLFRRALERKPVSLFWFRLVWPLLRQRQLIMPLVARKGIYCFYSRSFVRELVALADGRRCLEIAAGDGTLSRFVREEGGYITATDNYSWQDKIAFPASVERLEAAAALRQYQPEVVVCSWPPARNSFEAEVFCTRSVQLYIVIVSVHNFASGNWEAYAAQQDFTMEPSTRLAQLLLPPELGCVVLVFRRNASNSMKENHD